MPSRLASVTLSLGLVLAAQAAFPDLAPSDGVATSGLLPDAELYRLATCGAPPGGDCQGPALRWDKPALTLRIDAGGMPLDPAFEARLLRAASHAVAEVNSARAGIRLGLTNGEVADITIRPTDLPEGTVLTETPGFSGAGVMGVGFMTVWSDEANRITEAVILISTAIRQDDLPSVMLEEITQSLGFLYDVEGAAYEGLSILSQTSNATTILAGQDAALLRLHYPPP